MKQLGRRPFLPWPSQLLENFYVGYVRVGDISKKLTLSYLLRVSLVSILLPTK